MKVIIISDLPLNLNKVTGGVESATVNLLDGFGLVNDKIEVKVISFNKHVNKLIKYNEKVCIKFIKYWLPIALLDYFVNYRALNKEIKEFHPDIIHIQAATPHLLRLFFLNKKNIVVTQHGIMSEEYKTKDKTKDKLKFFFKLLIEKYYFPRFKNLIFISNYNKNLFPSRFNKVKKAIIPNALGSQYFENTYISGLNKNLIYIGGISKRKNIILLLKSLDYLAKKDIKFHLTIVGGFLETSYKKEVMNFINTSPINQFVNFVGWQDKNRVEEILKNHRIFILPSNQETLPISIAEAMISERIVIATNIAAIPEMINHQETGFLFDKNNQEQLSKILEGIYFEKYNLKKISEKSRDFAFKKYNPKIVASKTMSFYYEILN